MTTQTNEENIVQQVEEFFDQILEFNKQHNFQSELQLWQQSIDLLKQLPFDNPVNKDILASAHNNCGNTLANLRRFEDEIEHYQHAIELRTQLLPLDNPEYKKGLASAYHNCGSALYSLGKFEEAEEAIDESLKILKELEEQGIYLYRADREFSFKNAIIFFLNGSFNFLPELILEHLDPENSGSAPQSEKMHQDALKGLLELYQQVYYTHPKLIEEIEETIEKLAEIRAKYFTGTASGAKLTAQFYEENVGDLKKAEEILKKYVEKVPDDPEGYQLLADFYLRRNNPQQAIITYQNALKIILLQPFENTQKTAILELLKVLYILISQSKDWKTNHDVDQGIDNVTNWYQDWIVTLNEKIRPEIKTFHQDAFDDLKEQRKLWREQHDDLLKTNYRQQTQIKLEIQLQIFSSAAKALPASIKMLIDSMINAQQELWKKYEPQWETADETTRNFLLKEMVESLENTLKQVLLKLPDIELVEAETFLKKHLGNKIWEKLSDDEKKFLKVGINLSQKEMTYVFAATSLGCAVETTLKTKLFEPTKHYIKENHIPIHYRNPEDFIAGFFDNHPKARLMLGNLISGFNQAFHNGKIVTSPHNVLYLKQKLPHYQPNKEQQDYRHKTLWELLNIRNVLHYSSEQSEEKMQSMLDIILHNQQHGFYRYFFQSA
jgi:tetratricopeptide (TPR) repeat protein